MREEIERRALVIAFIGLIVGIAVKASIVNLAFLAGLIWVVRPASGKAVAAAACLVGLVIGPRPGHATITDRGYFQGEVTVVTVPRITRLGSACEVMAGGTRMELRLRAPAEVFLGDRLAVEAVAEPPNESEAGAFEARGVTCRIRPAHLAVVVPGPSVYRWAAGWRSALLDLTRRTLAPHPAAYVDALCFNVDADIDEESRTNLRKTGTIHIVSASGMHVVIVGFALLWLLGHLPIPRPVQLGIVGAVLAFYSIASGLQPPIVRATVMAVALLSAYLFRREPDWACALSLAGGLYLLWSPAAAYTPGFQLSFAAIAGLGLFGGSMRPPRGAWAAARAWLIKGIRVSFVASVASAPLVAYHFGMVSLASVPANVLIALVVTPVVIVALGATALSPVAPGVAIGLMKCVVGPLSGWFAWVVDSLGKPAISALDVPPFSGYWLVPIYLALLCLWRRRARPA